jgi:CDP-glucose 4,6-dehydratase
MNPEFWRDKRVFVTGHTGFKGAWLCLLLQLMGARVYGYARPPHTQPNLYNAARVLPSTRSTMGDVTDLEPLSSAFREAAPDIVFHLAAQAIVRESYADPTGTFATNVMGTANLLEVVRKYPSARAVVVVTSDKCYENREWYWSYREKSALGGRDPYSASKACAELVTTAFRRSYFESLKGEERISVASVRAGNVIGGGDWSIDRLVPDTIRALIEGRAVELRYPEAIRPWQHVMEPLSGYVLLAERLFSSNGAEFAEAWNFAPSEEDAKPVGWLVERLQQAWGEPSEWQAQAGSKPHEHIYLKLDSSKARARLNWMPRLRIDTTIDWVVAWYRAFQEGEDARDLCEASIARYVGLMPESAHRADALPTPFLAPEPIAV